MQRTTNNAHVTIVPAVPAAAIGPVIDLARAIAGADGGRTVILSVVEVPAGRSLSEGVSVARRRRELLRRIGVDLGQETVELSVRAARSFEEGVREAVAEYHATHLLLSWRGPLRSERRLRRSSLDRLVLDPPCDLTIFKPQRAQQTDRQPARMVWPPKRIVLPIRGGLHADRALDLAQKLCTSLGAELTILKINRAGSTTQEPFQPKLANVRVVEVEGPSVLEAIVTEASNHDLLILGASARAPRSSHLMGRLPEEVADAVHTNVMIVKTAEVLSAEMFAGYDSSFHSPVPPSISNEVDQWFAENTFHSHEFEDLERLVDLKERQNLKISVALPALNEEATIGNIISTITRRTMVDRRLVDELVVIDSNSSDNTVEIAERLGVPVFRHSEILTDYGTYVGKGEGLWKSLYVTKGDIVVWIDSDITDFHPKFVYGLLGPLLTEPRVEFVKGYYRRPLNLGGEQLTTGGGRVTELTARPLINLFYPLLSGLVQPLAGEMAGRRRLLEQLPFFTGYGVETGLLIDILERYGLDVIAQTDLENRIHRNQDMISLSKMAFAIVQVVMRRLEDRRHIQLLEDINTTMKLIHYSPHELFLEVKEIQEFERPPMAGIKRYGERREQTSRALAGVR